MRAPSLRARLRWLIILVMVIVLLPLAIFSFRRTLAEVNELSDGRLAQSARTLQVIIDQGGTGALQGRAHGGDRLVPTEGPSVRAVRRHGHTFESEVGFQVFDASGRRILATTNLAALPPPQAGDAEFRDIRADGYRWRLFTLDDPGGVVIRTGERYDSRHDIRRALWLDHGLPLLIGLPLLGLLVGWAVKRGLRPLESLTHALAARPLGSRESILLEDAPLELQPVLDALNGQLQRLADALEREHRFSADVAHELRTPLASIMLNIESATVAGDPAEATASLAGAQHNVAALARRVEQLLALARLESGMASEQARSIDLVGVAIDVIEELTPVIAECGAELGFGHDDRPVLVHGHEAALAALLRNLIENAMRHVPAGGQVQLSIAHGLTATTIDVADDGPGIPPERRAAVFARFHRESGSRGDGYGLGLSIVQRAAELHGATIELLDSPFGRGLRVHVAIPHSP
ncbi:MAG: two-component sensor histidine kinase [Rhodanobacter sp.]|nr:MAG: two-component sensor histidine kinase [Rhodanobacter sp.]TAL91530.1 MAG: two-component sensor histidine kinase [Rhodanobacter sp.]TAM42212.1 MAG: two-component sensor histidine kinase [Rhodanobacter sp.]TAN26435.1 MAG: two-component sensor histidine kinase [Rhodanobacter sp.]